MKQLTGNEQKAVAQRAKQQMDDVRKALEEETNQEQYRQFLQHWSVIEAGYKSLLQAMEELETAIVKATE